MKFLLQRVQSASVKVENELIAAIDHGLLVFAGFESGDDPNHLDKLINKMLKFRLFSDSQSKMNLSVQEISGEILFVSQFTLAADCKKGLRASFSSCATPELAKTLYDEGCEILKKNHPKSQFGRFAADMKIELINDGPVTFLLSDD